MSLVHEYLQAAASHALKGQNDVLKGVEQSEDDAHRFALVKASGFFNKLVQDIYRELERLERDDADDDGPDE